MRVGVVSIISPCYNTGKYIHRLLNSILEQTYTQIEMFVIDDGSEDNTKDVVYSYIPNFESKGYTLTYIYQSNQGQSAAINNGLKYITGEFLTWPDSDDFYSSSKSISTMVETLQNNPEYGLCRCLTEFVDEESLEVIKKIRNDIYFQKESLFEDCLFGENGYLWPPINYMCRMDSLISVNPQMKIFISKLAGQNRQMLLPLYYNYKCKSIPVILTNVLERISSHSRNQFRDYQSKCEKLNAYEATIYATLDSIQQMSRHKKEEYSKSIHNKYLKEHFLLAFRSNERKEAIRYGKEMRNGNVLSRGLWIKYLIASNVITYWLLKKIKPQ